MITIGKYLYETDPAGSSDAESKLSSANLPGVPSGVLFDAYRDALDAMGRSAAELCPAEVFEELGAGFRQNLESVAIGLRAEGTPEAVAGARREVRKLLREWSHGMVAHSQKQADEVREILLLLARTAERVGERDRLCAQRIEEVTGQLETIASLDDIPLLRESLIKSATDLKRSIDHIVAESSAEMHELQKQMALCEARLQQAERQTQLDSLTQLPNRLCMEKKIDLSIARDTPFCVAMLDLDGFKRVNDCHGHLTGDEVLRQFASELRSACRSSDVAGRWGGDELIILLDGALPDAREQIERIRTWVCGNYTVGNVQLRIDASIGVAGYEPGDTPRDLLQRADDAMYRRKGAHRTRISL
jgi:diguanylate cyclase (GGDEF)-like protein